ncbi:MAG: hypothetical protein ABR981_00225 [Candidatus Micrarchaeaceae archaeon]|jgi:hypothetical protein
MDALKTVVRGVDITGRVPFIDGLMRGRTSGSVAEIAVKEITDLGQMKIFLDSYIKMVRIVDPKIFDNDSTATKFAVTLLLYKLTSLRDSREIVVANFQTWLEFLREQSIQGIKMQ